MRKKLVIRAVSLVTAFVMCMGLTSHASAYSLMGYRHKVPKVYYYYDSRLDSKVEASLISASNAWKSKTTEIVMEPMGSDPDVIKVYVSSVYESNVTWDGITIYKDDDDNYITKMSIKFNLAKDSINAEEARQSVVAHELGHVFGLADLDMGNRAIMNGYTYGVGGRYETFLLTKPQSDDINGVNYLY